MKALLALLFGICITSISIYLHVQNKIDKKSLSILLGFTIIGSLAIANHDVMKKWSGFGVELETARDEIQGVKIEAINEIKEEVTAQKDAISILMRSANDLSEKLDKQKALAEALVKKAETLESEIESSQEQLLNIKTDVFAAKQDTQSAKTTTEELAKIITRIAYFQVATKNQFGTPKAQKAIQKIEDDLNRIINMIIPDTRERDAFVRNLTNELSEEQK